MAWLDQSLDTHRWGITRGWVIVGLAIAAWVAVVAFGWGAYLLFQYVT